MYFFRAFDIGRVTSLNHRQATLGTDGRLQLVVAHRDPGVANWLDTMGRHVGLLNYRHFWGSALPTLRTVVVPFDDVRAALPADTTLVDTDARQRELAARREHLAWRFRT
jgi:hypothetical protein